MRKHFPFFMHNPGYAFLDTAASAQKPQVMLDVFGDIYSKGYANIHRGNYKISSHLTTLYEQAREKIALFIGGSPENLIFTGGATAGLNMVAFFLRDFLEEGDEVLITVLEHHSNYLPWHRLCQEKKAILKVVPLDEQGEISFETFSKMLSIRTKICAFAHISNVTGFRLPVEEMVKKARSYGAYTVVDGCQGIVHEKLHIKSLECDFYVFSAHKLYGPNGLGIVYMANASVDPWKPYQVGGGMIQSFDGSVVHVADIPHCYEAGTQPIVEAIAFGAVVDFLDFQEWENCFKEEKFFVHAVYEMLEDYGFRVYGQKKHLTSLVAARWEGATSYDIGFLLDQCNIAVRAGSHCASPFHQGLNIPDTLRVSLGIYSTQEDLDILEAGLKKVQELLKK